ncbi:hypothetical protein GGR57DRAFT_369442 [Xylariaceae sp. FL1272]|nr:hypothetical protein GGR57DRAFT_369442 [Xylariaceae sp. FL1272]
MAAQLDKRSMFGNRLTVKCCRVIRSTTNYPRPSTTCCSRTGRLVLLLLLLPTPGAVSIASFYLVMELKDALVKVSRCDLRHLSSSLPFSDNGVSLTGFFMSIIMVLCLSGIVLEGAASDETNQLRPQQGTYLNVAASGFPASWQYSSPATRGATRTTPLEYRCFQLQ